MMSEGYERGLAYLPGFAIDQHFAQRNRFADMSALERVFPQVLGLGIDERTAVVVRGEVLEVIGQNRTAIYDRREAAIPGKREYRSLKAGQKYDLRKRAVFELF